MVDSNNLELSCLSIAILGNMLAFPDTPLVSREECVSAVLDRLDKVLDATTRCDVVISMQCLDTEMLPTIRLAAGLDP